MESLDYILHDSVIILIEPLCAFAVLSDFSFNLTEIPTNIYNGKYMA